MLQKETLYKGLRVKFGEEYYFNGVFWGVMCSFPQKEKKAPRGLSTRNYPQSLLGVKWEDVPICTY